MSLGFNTPPAVPPPDHPPSHHRHGHHGHHAGHNVAPVNLVGQFDAVANPSLPPTPGAPVKKKSRMSS